jgi:3-dehydroquinate dehydratase type II
MNILLLNGPNLSLLGEREPEVYGSTTLGEIEAEVKSRAIDLGASVVAMQSNHEGALIDAIEKHRKWAQAIIVNPGALTHYSYALRDAISAFGKPVIEVHLSNILEREEFRRKTVFEGLKNVRRIMGKGPKGYYEALEQLIQESDKG